MVDREKLREKLHFIERNLKVLEGLTSLSEEDFRTDPFKFPGATRLIQVSIEAMIDIGSHIVARERLGLPKKYREIFGLLARAGVLSAGLLPTYENMVKFRNFAVHLYAEVTPEEVLSIIKGHLGDFRAFIRDIVQYLDRQPSE